jgi:polyferredoxin
VTSKAILVAARFTLIVVAVLGLSWLSVAMWNETGEKERPAAEIQYHNGMTVAEFGQANGLERRAVKELLGLHSTADLQRPLTDFVPNPERLAESLHVSRVVQGESERKNWGKIAVKFSSWFIFLGFMFWILRTRRINVRNRRWFYLFALVLFGVMLGADPSPMGTVKDAIALYGAEGVIFPPRIVALGAFILMVVLANKFICGWGCQFGALQDFLFRLNRNSKDRKGLLPQFKPPFWFSSSIRIVFFAVFTAVAFMAAIDLIEPIDPFKVFKPMYLGITGAVFLAALLIASLFTYRPWCHFFCPFGLVGWLFEKVSIGKISVDYARCKDGCVVCEKACPSDCMEAILKQKRTIPDCFACATCLEACPTQAITFKVGRRPKPPVGKFGD